MSRTKIFPWDVENKKRDEKMGDSVKVKIIFPMTIKRLSEFS